MPKNKTKETEQKTCKKCGTPLPNAWKYKYCENCRRDRAEKRRNKIAGTVSVAALVGIVAKDKIAPLAQKAASHIKGAVNTATKHLMK